MKLNMLGMMAGLLLLPGCVSLSAGEPAVAPVRVKLIAFNDFHGNLEPPRQAVAAETATGETVLVPAGGAAYLAGAVSALRAENPNHVVVSAGDMIGASPLVSALFLDEPTISAMNLIGVDINAVGNHEFDRGRAELLRMKNGGCEKHTQRAPCRIDPSFPGARFDFLAANTITERGTPLFPSVSMRSFGSGARRVRVGFIGMTLKETPSVVTPAGVEGLSFRDEADTANALVPKLKAKGADAIVVLIHQGAATKGSFNSKNCEGMSGELLPILDRLDPAIDVVVSGHTHNAYVCDYGRINPTRPFLVTSAGRYGTLLTDIDLVIDPAADRVSRKSANNLLVQSEAFAGPNGRIEPSALFPAPDPDPAVGALIARYAEAAAPLAARVVGRLAASATRAATPSGEFVLGNLVADAQLAATRSPAAGGAQIAFMNAGGIRADLVPAGDGSITFGQLFAVQPFGNTLVVKSMTGRQIRALLEQQFGASGAPRILQVSSSFRYAYDASRPPGQRIIDARLEGRPLADEEVVRVTMNSFLASGGDGYTIFRAGTDPLGGPPDLDALESYFSGSSVLAAPAPDRTRNLTPAR